MTITPLRRHHSRLSAMGLSLWLLLGTAAAIAWPLLTPAPAHAYTARVSLHIYRGANEPFAAFLTRAQQVARAGVQRSLDVDLLTTEVIVTVTGENQGIAVPILTVQVTRDQWRDRPDTALWSTYFPTAQALLDL